MQFDRRKSQTTPLNIAPLVDVIFLLLLFFMLTSRMVAEPTIEISLPGSSTAEVRTPSSITITISANGDLYLEDSSVSLGILTHALKQRLETEEQPSVHLRADEQTDVGLLVHVVDCITMSGCTSFSIETEAE